jgi:hypothetical protein
LDTGSLDLASGNQVSTGFSAYEKASVQALAVVPMTNMVPPTMAPFSGTDIPDTGAGVELEVARLVVAKAGKVGVEVISCAATVRGTHIHTINIEAIMLRNDRRRIRSRSASNRCQLILNKPVRPAG